MVYKKCATVLYHCYSCFFYYYYHFYYFVLFFAPPAPFVGYIKWTCHYVTDTELINLPWFLAPFAPDWMFAVSWLNPQHLYPTRILPRSHAHFWIWPAGWGVQIDCEMYCLCVFLFFIWLVSGCNKEFIYHRDGLSSSSFCLILDSSVGLSMGIQSAGDLVSETLMGSNPALSRGRQLVSFRFEYRLPVPEHRN